MKHKEGMPLPHAPASVVQRTNMALPNCNSLNPSRAGLHVPGAYRLRPVSSRQPCKRRCLGNQRVRPCLPCIGRRCLHLLRSCVMVRIQPGPDPACFCSVLARLPALLALPALFSYDHVCKLWDTRQLRCLTSVDHGAPIESVAFFPSGEWAWAWLPARLPAAQVSALACL